MSRAEFEPTISLFEWAKTLRALDRAANVIGNNIFMEVYLSLDLIRHHSTKSLAVHWFEIPDSKLDPETDCSWFS